MSSQQESAETPTMPLSGTARGPRAKRPKSRWSPLKKFLAGLVGVFAAVGSVVGGIQKLCDFIDDHGYQLHYVCTEKKKDPVPPAPFAAEIDYDRANFERDILVEDEMSIALAPSESRDLGNYQTLQKAPRKSYACAAVEFDFTWQVRSPYPPPVAVQLVLTTVDHGSEFRLGDGNAGKGRSVSCGGITAKNNSPVPITVHLRYLVSVAREAVYPPENVRRPPAPSPRGPDSGTGQSPQPAPPPALPGPVRCVCAANDLQCQIRCSAQAQAQAQRK